MSDLPVTQESLDRLAHLEHLDKSLPTKSLDHLAILVIPEKTVKTDTPVLLDPRVCLVHLVHLVTTELQEKMVKTATLEVLGPLDQLDLSDLQDIRVKMEDQVLPVQMDTQEKMAKMAILEDLVKTAKMDTLVDKDSRVLQDHQVILDILVKTVPQESLDLKVTQVYLAIQGVPENLDYLEHQATSQVPLDQLAHQVKMATRRSWTERSPWTSWSTWLPWTTRTERSKRSSRCPWLSWRSW